MESQKIGGNTWVSPSLQETATYRLDEIDVCTCTWILSITYRLFTVAKAPPTGGNSTFTHHAIAAYNNARGILKPHLPGAQTTSWNIRALLVGLNISTMYFYILLYYVL